MMEFGSRWFAKSKINTFNQVHNSTSGRRPSMVMGCGDWFEVRIGPERALQMPNAVSGKTIDFKSFRVTSHTVCNLSKTDGGDCSCGCSCQPTLLFLLPSFPFYHGQMNGGLRTSGSCFTKGSKGDSSLQGSAVDMFTNGFDLSIATSI